MTVLRIVNKGFNASFWTEMNSIVTSKSRTKDTEWLSMKELTDKFGDEAPMMSRVLPKRRNPCCPQSWQFMITADKTSMGVVQKIDRRTSAATKTSTVQHASLVDSLNMDITDDTFDDAMDGFQGPLGDIDNTSGIDAAALPGPARLALKRGREDQDDMDKNSMISGHCHSVKDGKDHQKKKQWSDKFLLVEDDNGYAKCKLMHNELQKLLMHIQAVEFVTKKAKYQPDQALRKDIKEKQVIINKLLVQMNTFVVQKQASKVKVQTALATATMHYREALDMVTKMDSLNKPSK